MFLISAYGLTGKGCINTWHAGSMPGDDRDEVTVAPAMQFSLVVGEPDTPIPELADTASQARSLAAEPTVDERRAAAESVLARGYVSTTVYGPGSADRSDEQDPPGERA